MAGLIASLASGNIEKLLDTQVSRRGLWMSAAAIAAISGATYGILTWEPVSRRSAKRAIAPWVPDKGAAKKCFPHPSLQPGRPRSRPRPQGPGLAPFLRQPCARC